jgi:hypothetical protein
MQKNWFRRDQYANPDLPVASWVRWPLRHVKHAVFLYFLH